MAEPNRETSPCVRKAPLSGGAPNSGNKFVFNASLPYPPSGGGVGGQNCLMLLTPVVEGVRNGLVGGPGKLPENIPPKKGKLEPVEIGIDGRYRL